MASPAAPAEGTSSPTGPRELGASGARSGSRQPALGGRVPCPTLRDKSSARSRWRARPEARRASSCSGTPLAVTATSCRLTKAVATGGVRGWPWKVALKLTVPATIPATPRRQRQWLDVEAVDDRGAAIRRKARAARRWRRRTRCSLGTNIRASRRSPTSCSRVSAAPISSAMRPPSGTARMKPAPPGASSVPAPSNWRRPTTARPASDEGPADGEPFRSARRVRLGLVVVSAGTRDATVALIDAETIDLDDCALESPLGRQHPDGLLGVRDRRGNQPPRHVRPSVVPPSVAANCAVPVNLSTSALAASSGRAKSGIEVTSAATEPDRAPDTRSTSASPVMCMPCAVSSKRGTCASSVSR